MLRFKIEEFHVEFTILLYRIYMHEAFLKLFRPTEDVAMEIEDMRKKGIPISRFSLNRLIAHYYAHGKLDEMLK